MEAIIGVDSSDPRHELDRTEFVRVDSQHGLIRRIVNAAAIDTVVDTRLVVDPMAAPLGEAHQSNAIGTANILAACAGGGSPVRKFVFKSSADFYGCEPGDPAFFTEDMARPHPPRTAMERDIVNAEGLVADFAARNRGTSVTVLRVASGIAVEERASHLALLALPIVPTILGFDPRCQFIHEDDIVGVLEHTVRYDLPGVFNAAADGVLALSEVISLLGKPMLPILPPWGTSFAAAQLRRAGLRVPVEMLRQLRFGRGLDNRRLKASGYSYRYTTREAVVRLRAQQRLRPLLRSGTQPYQYDREVEDFLRWSPSVQALQADPPPSQTFGDVSRAAPPLASYDDLGGEEVIEIVASLEADALEALAHYEATHLARRTVLAAIERSLSRKRPSGAAS